MSVRANRVRSEITYAVFNASDDKVRRLGRLVEMLLRADNWDNRTRHEISEAIAENVYPKDLDRIAEVYHPNGEVS